jgi:site-specific DNA recombinase
MRAVIYARISEDHEKAESVPTQIANGSSTLSEWAGTWCESSKTRGSPAIPARRGRVRGDAEAPQQRAGRRAGRAASRPADPQPGRLARLMRICEKSKVKISLYTGGELDLSTASGGFYGFMETGTSWYESAIRSLRVKDAIERNVRAGRRTGGGSRPFGYRIIRHDQGEGAQRRWRIVGEELEPAEADAIKEAATRVLKGESLRSISMDWNRRGVKTVGGGRWQGSMIRRALISPRIAGLREHHGEIVGEAQWPAIIDRARHDRLVGLLKDTSRRPLNYGRPRAHALAGLVRCSTCGGPMVSFITRNLGRGYGCRRDENPDCAAHVRIAAEPLEAYVEGYVIDQWRNPLARKIAQSDSERMERIAEISDEMSKLQAAEGS